jgi:RNA-dependent RNA polymerase
VKPFQDRKHGNHEINAAEIIGSLGTFDGLAFDPKLVFCPARYAARIAQAFTATDAVKVDVERVLEIEDITTTDGEYNFTDGVGTISNELRRNIWSQLRSRKPKHLCEDPPSAYQIRFMGSKGMVSVDHTLPGSTVCLRPSMIKFQAPTGQQHDIEIARAFDQPGAFFLNRPLIMLLEGLGVPFYVFKKYQDDAIKATERAATSLNDAATLLDEHGLGPRTVSPRRCSTWKNSASPTLKMMNSIVK